MTFPNFFIVGAPKCGTTALSEYLRDHPNVYFSWPKEPHYFAEDFDRYRRIGTRKAYLNLFRSKTERHMAVGEASVWYLYSQVAPRLISEFNPDAKIIVMLRNPVEMVYSLHSQMAFTFYEDEPDFGKAWELQAIRRTGQQIPVRCPEPALLQYAATAKFAAQMKRLLSEFDRSQVMVILTEEFSRSTKEKYEDVLRFLNLPLDGRREFPRINLNTVHRRPRLAQFLYHPPPPFRWLEPRVKALLVRLGVAEFRGWHKLMSLSAENRAREPLSSEMRTRLREEFREDVLELSQILDRDLSHWINDRD